MMCQLSVVESKSATFPSEKARHLLDDSVLESRSPRRGLALTSSSAVTNGLSLGKRPGLHTTAGPQPACAHVCLSLCSAPWPLALQEVPEPWLPGFQGFTECPRSVLVLLAALSPEHGRQVEGAARGTPETRRCWLAAVKARLPPQWGFCPWGATGPSGQRRGGEAA